MPRRRRVLRVPRINPARVNAKGPRFLGGLSCESGWLQLIFIRVREGGLEPPRPFEHWHLKPARLPIPPLARTWKC